MNINRQITINDTVVQEQGNLVSNMDKDKVMLSIKNGKYYNLGEVGGDIWELIKEPTPVAELVNKLMEIYEVEQSTCEAQVISFLEKLLAEGLITTGENR